MFMRKKKTTVNYRGQAFIIALWIRFWLKCRDWEDNCGEFSEIIIMQLKKRKTKKYTWKSEIFGKSLYSHTLKSLLLLHSKWAILRITVMMDIIYWTLYPTYCSSAIQKNIEKFFCVRKNMFFKTLLDLRHLTSSI